ncbi:MAG: SDR family oxidoreductase [Verrucomicrobia bacterium]|nr:SDR family oxidoreductase [Verrucomicrobiota bacterium]
MDIDLSHHIALVTGATGELGCVMARTLARCGASVAIHYHKNADRAAVLSKEIPRSCTVSADVTKPADVERMRNEVTGRLGAPDIIVNNAVIQYQWERVLKQSPQDYRSQFESCVLHNVLMAQAFVPGMIARKWGRVIAINTECAMQCWPGQSAYVSGKRGMDGVLRCLAKEVGEHGITVNQVAPGWTVSENRPAKGRPDGYLNAVPLKRWGLEQDIANVVAFLASDLAAYITGAYIPVCGGNVMPSI